MRARLTVLNNGSGDVTVTPPQANYEWGTLILLTATTASGSQFLGWGGTGISGITNPLPVLMTTNRIISANFGENYNQPLHTAADYRFQSSLSSSVGTPPDLTCVGSGHYFTNELVDGLLRTILRFPQGSGLQLKPATTVFASNVYTVAILLKFDNVSGFRRILDVKNGTSDSGFYVYGGKIYFGPSMSSPTVFLTNNVGHQVVLTRDSQGQVVLYCDGAQRLAFNDGSTRYGAINSSNTMRFFKDNGTEESAGSVARIRNYASSLSPAEVAGLERLPGRSPAARLHGPIINMLGAVTFDIEAPAGLVHCVQASTNLTSWQNLTPFVSPNGLMQFIDLESTNYTWRFYRVVSP